MMKFEDRIRKLVDLIVRRLRFRNNTKNENKPMTGGLFLHGLFCIFFFFLNNAPDRGHSNDVTQLCTFI